MAAKSGSRKRVEMQSEEARRAFSECLERAGFGGERIVISRFGKELAALISIADLEQLEKSHAA